MSSQLVNLGLVFILIQVSRKFDTTDPNVILGIRAAYVISQLVILGGCFYIKSKITQKHDQTVLKYVEPKPGNPEGELVVTTHEKYDLDEVQKQIKQTLIGLAIIAGIHIYFGTFQPLFLQTVIPVRGFLTSKVAQIHLWGKAAEGDLKRPFVAEGPFAAMTQPKTDEASIKKAEEAAGKKDE
ncbi:uncharacterized protein VTP21DRAFT_6390 [Calcarisporiella thermophila]|uniref:uncharacterized protein n=1 Tax=Calcarisporiella thermophila TaxID=911321 RepID=UPI0037449B36